MCKDVLGFLSNHEALVGAIAGGLMSLLGSYFVLKNEQKKQEQERVERIKPILINYNYISGKDKDLLPKYIFSSGDEIECGNIEGVFKNTDNAIAFIDLIETKNKIYKPLNDATVDKNTGFVLVIKNLHGENFENCKIHFHDILGNQYYYNMKFAFGIQKKSDIIIDGKIIRME